MTRPHVLYVHPNSEVGGSDIALVRTIEAMAQSGQRSTVVLPHDGPLVPRLRAAGAEIEYLSMQQLRTLPSVRYQAGYLAKLLPTTLKLRRIMKRVNPDLVHSNSAYCLYGAFAAKLAGLPHIWHVREMAPQVPVLTKAYAGMVSWLSTIVLAMSDTCVDALYSRAPAHTRIMPDALDSAEFRSALTPDRVRCDLGISADTPVVGFAARLDPWKGAHIFLDAASEVAKTNPDAVFLIAGGSPDGLESYKAELVEQARILGLTDRVRFLDWRYQLADMVDVFDAFNVFCHTSTTAEPFGLVLLEAMCVGTPVIASDAGGPRTILEDGVSGYLTPINDSAALAVKIQALLADKSLAKSIGQKGRDRQEALFSVPTFIKNLSAIYDETLKIARR